MIALIIFLAALSSLLAVTIYFMARMHAEHRVDIIEMLLDIDNLKEELKQVSKANAAQAKSSTVAEDNVNDWNIYLKNHYGKGWK